MCGVWIYGDFVVGRLIVDAETYVVRFALYFLKATRVLVSLRRIEELI